MHLTAAVGAILQEGVRREVKGARFDELPHVLLVFQQRIDFRAQPRIGFTFLIEKRVPVPGTPFHGSFDQFCQALGSLRRSHWTRLILFADQVTPEPELREIPIAQDRFLRNAENFCNFVRFETSEKL